MIRRWRIAIGALAALAVTALAVYRATTYTPDHFAELRPYIEKDETLYIRSLVPAGPLGPASLMLRHSPNRPMKVRRLTLRKTDRSKLNSLHSGVISKEPDWNVMFGNGGMCWFFADQVKERRSGVHTITVFGPTDSTGVPNRYDDLVLDETTLLTPRDVLFVRLQHWGRDPFDKP